MAKQCAICAGAMRPDQPEHVYRCSSCGFFASNLPIKINRLARIDEATRARALRDLRRANYKQLLDACEVEFRAGASVLDVGCAHGWFLEELQVRGLSGTGIEPDIELARSAAAAGHHVIVGYFPAALPQGQKFDLITFNDVFEHLPDPVATIRAVAQVLAPGGAVMVNLPLSDGAIFRACRAAARLGLSSPLQRMWQVGLPSPHLSYFSRATLPRLFARGGFELVRQGRLASLVTRGLHDRIRFDRGVGFAQAALIFGAALALRPLVGLLPADIGYFVFRRAPDRAAPG